MIYISHIEKVSAKGEVLESPIDYGRIWNLSLSNMKNCEWLYIDVLLSISEKLYIYNPSFCRIIRLHSWMVLISHFLQTTNDAYRHNEHHLSIWNMSVCLPSLFQSVPWLKNKFCIFFNHYFWWCNGKYWHEYVYVLAYMYIK